LNEAWHAKPYMIPVLCIKTDHNAALHSYQHSAPTFPQQHICSTASTLPIC